MVETEMSFVKVQRRGAGNFMVTIPKEIAEDLKLESGSRIKVIFDKDKKRIIYQKSSG